MMRLSPRLICFIGAAGTFQSVLAAQEGPNPEEVRNLMSDKPFEIGAIHVRKFKKMNKQPKKYLFVNDVLKVDNMERVVQLNSRHCGKHRILELQSTRETRYLCNIRSIKKTDDEWVKNCTRYVFTGMECQFNKFEPAEGPQITKLAEFEIFVNHPIPNMALGHLREELITSFELSVHKFKVQVPRSTDGLFKDFTYYTCPENETKEEKDKREQAEVNEYKLEDGRNLVLYFGYDSQCKPLITYVAGNNDFKAIELSKFILHQYRDSNDEAIVNPHFAEAFNVETKVEFILQGDNKVIEDSQMKEPKERKKFLHFCPHRDIPNVDEDLCNKVKELYGEELFQFNFNGRQAAEPSDFEFLKVEETEDVEPAVDAQDEVPETVDAQDEVPETLIQRMHRNGIVFGGPQAQQDRNRALKRALKRAAEKRTS